jgi:hypothetical protein
VIVGLAVVCSKTSSFEEVMGVLFCARTMWHLELMEY